MINFVIFAIVCENIKGDYDIMLFRRTTVRCSESI